MRIGRVGKIKLIGTLGFCAALASIPLVHGQDEGAVAGVIGPDVIVSQLRPGGAPNGGYGYEDPNGNGDLISAFSFGTVSCNIGDINLDWFPSTGSNQHPVIAQGMFRLKGGRFEQIGLSWLKHGFYALNEDGCGIDGRCSVSGAVCTGDGQGTCPANNTCDFVPICTGPNPNDGTHLYVGCSDPYEAYLNGNRNNLGPTWEVNAHTGFFPAIHTVTGNPSTTGIGNRLQVHNYDLNPADNAGAVYFVQGHYVHPDDAAFNNDDNNASYARAAVSRTPPPNTDPNRFSALITGTTQVEQPAIRAWEDYSKVCSNKHCSVSGAVCTGTGQGSCPSNNVCEFVVCGSETAPPCPSSETCDSTVVETDARVFGEGLFLLAGKVTNLGTGFYHYEFAVQNLNSDRSGGSFSVPLPVGLIVNNIGFHDVDYHDGDGLKCDGCHCVGGSRAGLTCDVPSDCPGGSCGGGTRLNFDGTDWPATLEVGSIHWDTTPYLTNPNANALRWSTLYNFRFDANVGPDPNGTSVTLGLFKPGFPSEIAIRTVGPDGVLRDCNRNGIPDSCDVNCDGLGCAPPCGESQDCDANGVPDECADDCNHNHIPDACDVSGGTSEDCNENGVPDECEPDCDGDGIINECEQIVDCDQDSVLDCDDLCPCVTPAGGCLPPYSQLVICCFSSGIYTDRLTWSQCIANGVPVCDDPIICPGTPCPETSCRCGCLPGEYDRTAGLDLRKVSLLWGCFSGDSSIPAFVAPSVKCLVRFDFDEDGDVDLADHRAFADAYAGP